jgi:uncharacterized protein YndB with AHSA1/START domain
MTMTKLAQLSRRGLPLLLAAGALAISLAPAQGAAPAAPGLSVDAETLHQVVHIDAPRARIYAALTDEAQYAQVQKLGVAMNSNLDLGHAPAAISRDVGGPFVLFGGHVQGRNIELTPGTRIVQAWREMTWQPGVYSVIHIELADEGAGTRITFDQSGFPKGGGSKLAMGWYQNYWEPLKRFLG